MDRVLWISPWCGFVAIFLMPVRMGWCFTRRKAKCAADFISIKVNMERWCWGRLDAVIVLSVLCPAVIAFPLPCLAVWLYQQQKIVHEINTQTHDVKAHQLYIYSNSRTISSIKVTNCCESDLSTLLVSCQNLK
ncbi:hypothetical protein QQ045_029700 [Rhodiola kirilowii]